jgi:uncharacterized membrane protein YvlD (DUF360 family)
VCAGIAGNMVYLVLEFFDGVSLAKVKTALIHFLYMQVLEALIQP